jgi:hypothetical protein
MPKLVFGEMEKCRMDAKITVDSLIKKGYSYLYDLHWLQNKSASQISKDLGTSRSTILRALRKLNIQIRGLRPTLLSRSGIYVLQNFCNGKSYIGSAKNMSMRKGHHRYNLEKGTHKNKFLQADYYLYGWEVFEFKVLEYVDKEEDLEKIEQVWLDKYQSYNRKYGYNIEAKSNGSGKPAETKHKIGIAFKNKTWYYDKIKGKRIWTTK